MRVIPVDQNSEQWEQLRRGRVTASAMSRIACPEMVTKQVCESCGVDIDRRRKTCPACGGNPIEVQRVKPSAQQDGYLFELACEALCNVSKQRPQNYELDRGHEQEVFAVEAYQFQTDRETERIGFVTTDDALIGASPDRKVRGMNRGVEVKTHEPWVHLAYLAEPGLLTKTHFPQIQGQLLVCSEWDSIDVVGYSQLPDGTPLPLIVETVQRDEAYISGLNDLLVPFITRLHTVIAELRQKYGEFPRAAVAMIHPPADLGVSEADVERILESQR